MPWRYRRQPEDVCLPGYPPWLAAPTRSRNQVRPCMRNFEPVLKLDDWYDGPRSGHALLGGVPHAFRSRMLDVTEYRGEFESTDVFELVPLGPPSVSAPVLASALFRRSPSSSSTGWEVSWQVIGLPSA